MGHYGQLSTYPMCGIMCGSTFGTNTVSVSGPEWCSRWYPSLYGLAVEWGIGTLSRVGHSGHPWEDPQDPYLDPIPGCPPGYRTWDLG